MALKAKHNIVPRVLQHPNSHPRGEGSEQRPQSHARGRMSFRKVPHSARRGRWHGRGLERWQRDTFFGMTGEYGTPFTGISNEARMNVYQNPGQSYGPALAAASAKGPTQGGAALGTGAIGSALSWLGGAGCH